jgi:Mg2+/Co2+ transporter CorB
MEYIYFFLAFCLSPSPSGFFSGSETALALTNRTDGAIAALAERPQQTLLSILFCNHWANTLPVVVLSSWATVLFGSSWGVIVMIAHGFHQLAFGEMLAKAYSQLYADKVAGFVSPILIPIVSLLGPWLVKIAPSRQKTAAEKCLEERLKAEAEADRLSVADLIKVEGIKKLDKDEVASLIVSSNAKLSTVEREIVKRCTEKASEQTPKHKMMANFYVKVEKYNDLGSPVFLGYLHSSSFQFKDWDHNN